MRLVVLCIILAVFIEKVSCWTSPDHHKAVTRFDGLESFYLEMQELNPLPADMGDKKSENGDVFCSTVFQTEYFYTRLENYEEVNSWKIRSELWKYRREILNQLYDCNWFQIFTCALGPPCTNTYQYKFKRQTVTVANNRIDDFMHMCLVREEQTQSIKQYFISRPYKKRPNDDPHYDVAFLFTFNRKNELVLDATIEETPLDIVYLSLGKRRRLEHEYTSALIKNIPSHRYSSGNIARDGYNRMCHLSDGSKLRLCTSIMDMKIYKFSFKFWPVKFNVEYTCKWRQLEFWIKQGREYHEWTLTCKARYKKSGKITIFYISEDSRSYSTTLVYMDSMDRRGMLAIFGESTKVTVMHYTSPNMPTGINQIYQ